MLWQAKCVGPAGLQLEVSENQEYQTMFLYLPRPKIRNLQKNSDFF